MKRSKISCFLLAGILTACGNSSDSDSSPPAAASKTTLYSQIACGNTLVKSPGIYYGNITSNGEQNFGLIAPNGLAMFAHGYDPIIYAGCLKESGNSLSGSFNIYEGDESYGNHIEAAKAVSGKINASIDDSNPKAPFLSGTLTFQSTAGMEEYRFDETYDADYSYYPITVAQLAGHYYDQNIDPRYEADVTASGKLTLTDHMSGCKLAATLSKPREDLNVLLVGNSQVTCGTATAEDAMIGLVSATDSSLFIAVANNNTGLVVRFQKDIPPQYPPLK